MSDFWKRYYAARERSAVEVKGGADYESLPLISQLLAGQLAEDGKSWKVPPYKLLLFLEADYCKWCFTAGDHEPKLWGTSPGLAEGLLGVERALADENCKWNQPKQSSNGLTKH